MPETAVCDSGPLVATADRRDAHHAQCLELLRNPDLRIVIPAMAVAEAAYLIALRAGTGYQVRFLRGLTAFEVEVPLAREWSRIADLVERYADFPLDGTDASIVALAERLKTDLILTLDRRHFGAIKPLHVESFRLLPE